MIPAPAGTAAIFITAAGDVTEVPVVAIDGDFGAMVLVPGGRLVPLAHLPMESTTHYGTFIQVQVGTTDPLVGFVPATPGTVVDVGDPATVDTMTVLSWGITAAGHRRPVVDAGNGLPWIPDTWRVVHVTTLDLVPDPPGAAS